MWNAVPHHFHIGLPPTPVAYLFPLSSRPSSKQTTCAVWNNCKIPESEQEARPSDATEQGAPVDFVKAIDRSTVKGRTALVTCAGSGIGLSIATLLSESGAHVTFADVDEGGAARAVESLKQHGHSAQYIKTDVTSWDEQVAAFAFAAKSSPQNTLDIVVTAAGITTMLAQVLHPSEQDAPVKPPTATIDINLIGTYYSMTLAQWYFRHSPAHASKTLLFISSLAGYSPPSRHTMTHDYTASKYGVRGLWQHLRRQGAKHGHARFNLLAPFFIDTPMLTHVQEMRAAGVKFGTLDDVVDAAMRCLCDVEVSGCAVAVCGGEANGGVPGSANFDLMDEFSTGSAGKALIEGVPKFFGPPQPST